MEEINNYDFITFDLTFSLISANDRQFFDFCQENRDLRIERNEFGNILIMPPVDSETVGEHNKTKLCKET